MAVVKNKDIKISFLVRFVENMKGLTIISILLILLAGPTLAQQKIKLVEGASSLKSGEKDGMRFNKFVRSEEKRLFFIHQNTKIYCDTAVLYKNTNTVEAIGHVLINDNDSIRITSDSLVYDGNTRIARLRGDVVLTDDSVTLKTNFLDYYRLENTAHYFNDGSLKDGSNRLTSRKGYYQTLSKVMSFQGDVILINPEYTLKTDTLVYNTLSKNASTYSDTEVISKNGNSAIAKAGTYNTTQMQTTLAIGKIETQDYFLEGDVLFFDDISKVYTATQNVKMISKQNDVIITGDHAQNNLNTKITKIYGNSLLRKVVNEDTLFLAADTLISIDDSLEANKRILAFHNVKIFKADLQGVADSMAYFLADSIIHFYNDPILWTGTNQMSADSINLIIENNTINRMKLSFNSFVIQRDTLRNFNQIKGRKMIARFKDNAIETINVYGNGESLFHALENDSIMIGMNNILCSNMLITFRKNTLEDISFYTNPEAAFYPPHEITDEIKQLKGFEWRKDLRPTKKEVLTKKEEQPFLPETDIQANPLEAPAKKPTPNRVLLKTN